MAWQDVKQSRLFTGLSFVQEANCHPAAGSAPRSHRGQGGLCHPAAHVARISCHSPPRGREALGCPCTRGSWRTSVARWLSSCLSWCAREAAWYYWRSSVYRKLLLLGFFFLNSTARFYLKKSNWIDLYEYITWMQSNCWAVSCCPLTVILL